MNKTFLPKPTQELLLKSAFLPKEMASAAWAAWKELADIHDIDLGSSRLMPLVYAHLKHSHAADFQMNKMKGIYRYTWAKNQHLFHSVQPALIALHEAKIPMLLLKGAALALSHYRDFGLRPMQDFDLLVPEDKVLEALEVLRLKGWSPKYLKFRTVKKFNPTFLSVYPSMCLTDPKDAECDLHWRVDGLEEDLWKFAEPFDWNGLPLFLPSPTEQLLHVCIHGTEFNLNSSIRWVGDALMLLIKNSAIDWERLIDISRRGNFALPMKETLAYLRGEFNAPIPLEVLSALRDLPITAETAAYYEKKWKPERSRSAWENWVYNISFLWRHHSQLYITRRIRFFTFARFLQRLWGLDSLLHLPFHLICSQIRFWRKNFLQ
jgi:hypothetical protein